MKTCLLYLSLFLLSCGTTLKSESKSVNHDTYLPEIQFLIDYRVPISEEMKAKKFPETWSGNLKSSQKNYKVLLGSSSIERRSLSIAIELKENMNRTGAGRQKQFFFRNSKIHIIRNNEPIPPKFESGESYNNAETGISFYFEDGILSKAACFYYYDACGETISLNPKGEVIKVTKEKTQCKKGCGQLIPSRIPGYYSIADNKVRVRKEPSTKSEIITELSKDTPIEVIADAEVYEEVFPHYGTWGKVRLDDGQEGYVYGAFLRAPAEPDLVAIREKAEAWKKINGWKGK